MPAFDLYVAQMPNSTLQSARVYWRDMLHMEQLPTDMEWYKTKKEAHLAWFNSFDVAARQSQ